MSEVVMEWGLLERLCGDQPDFMQHLITLFIEDAQKDQGELGRACTTGALDEIERVAHRMRGAAKTMGAQRVALGCDQLQAAAKAGNLERVAGEVASIDDELALLFALLRTRLEALSAPH